MIKIDGKLLSVMRRAITDHNMIQDGDKIAVGLSGGKDSMVLAAALATYRIFSPQKFSLCAITIDLGFEGTDFSGLIEFCKAAEIEYHIEHTQIADVVFNIRKEPNPCSLCSKMRRGALSTVLNSRGYNKLALGHHGDDLAETLLLSLFYEGRLSTFAPLSFMDRTGVTLIRPFVYAKEKDIAAAARSLPVLHNPCPANHHTKREYVKNLLKSLESDMPGVKERILGAITHPARNNLWDSRQLVSNQIHPNSDESSPDCPATTDNPDSHA